MIQKTILVADDETHILNVVSLKLRNAGYRVVCAVDGEDAYERALHERPDLLITDYQMPRMSGLDLCQKLHQLPEFANLPAIMLSARGYQLEESDTLAGGISAMISKPFSPRQLLTEVEQILAKNLAPVA